MAKKLAHKKNKRLLTASEINDENLNSGEFSENWKGRIFLLDTEKSRIAQEMGIEEEGEYAIKVR